MSEREDYYEILGVKPGATMTEITDAYRYKAYLHHPDRLAGVPDSVRWRAVEDLKRINLAYEVLSDRHKRERYDAECAKKKHSERADVPSSPRQPARTGSVDNTSSARPASRKPGTGIKRILSSRPVISMAKIVVSLLVMTVFIITLWTLYELFVQKVEPVSGTVRIAALLVLLAGMFYLVNRPVLQQAWPEFAMIFWLVLLVIVVAAFAGVQPLAQVKDNATKLVAEELNKLRWKR